MTVVGLSSGRRTVDTVDIDVSDPSMRWECVEYSDLNHSTWSNPPHRRPHQNIKIKIKSSFQTNPRWPVYVSWWSKLTHLSRSLQTHKRTSHWRSPKPLSSFHFVHLSHDQCWWCNPSDDLDNVKLDLDDQPIDLINSTNSHQNRSQARLNSNRVNTKLEYHLTIAKTVKGASAVKLIKDSLSSKGVYVFGELLNLPGISEVCTSMVSIILVWRGWGP